jgi:transketolase
VTQPGKIETTRGRNSLKPSDEEIAFLKDRAKFCRLETIRLIEIAKVGHYTSVFSAAELFSALYYDAMNVRRGEPKWEDRDRFMMGKGHAAVGIFPILADLEFIDSGLLDGYTRLGSPLGDHPDMTKVPGIDFSSGSIGHALSAGCGMALAGRMSDKEFFTFVMIGDGELQEGQVWEAALFGAHNKLGKLIGIIDRNGYQLDGSVDDIIGVEPIVEKWQAFGWETHVVDGHDVAAVATLLRTLKANDERTRPVMIVAQTVKGKGVSYMETEPGWHLGYLDPSDAARAIAEIEAMEI